jgi:hypothetical protein
MFGVPGALLPSMGIALNPSAAGAMMAFSSVAVVANSLLLRRQFGRVVGKGGTPSQVIGGNASLTPSQELAQS